MHNRALYIHALCTTHSRSRSQAPLRLATQATLCTIPAQPSHPRPPRAGRRLRALSGDLQHAPPRLRAAARLAVGPAALGPNAEPQHQAGHRERARVAGSHARRGVLACDAARAARAAAAGGDQGPDPAEQDVRGALELWCASRALCCKQFPGNDVAQKGTHKAHRVLAWTDLLWCAHWAL